MHLLSQFVLMVATTSACQTASPTLPTPPPITETLAIYTTSQFEEMLLQESERDIGQENQKSKLTNNYDCYLHIVSPLKKARTTPSSNVSETQIPTTPSKLKLLQHIALPPK